MSPGKAAALNGRALPAELEALFHEPLTETSYVDHVSRWLDEEQANAQQLRCCAICGVGCSFASGRKSTVTMFSSDCRTSWIRSHLIPVETAQARRRVGVSAASRSTGGSAKASASPTRALIFEGALDQANYCIKCHNQGKDSLLHRPARERRVSSRRAFSAVTLNGCPLDEKISEMHVAKQEGNPIGALAIVTIDNPMCAGTGHRICNDCMKSCIYQKQDPVDIPQAETRTLKDVLELPWGFEIYSLLTRWNPLNIERPFPESGDRIQGAGRRTRARRDSRWPIT